MTAAERRCRYCGTDIAGRRSDAIVCGPGCRRELSRLRALMSGKRVGPYETLAQYAARRQRRAKRAGGV